EIEVAQIGRDVIGETVRRYPAADVHAYCAKLLFARACLHPDSSLAGYAKRGRTEIRSGANHYFLEPAHIPHHVAVDGSSVQQGASASLARAVISDISAAAGLEILHILLLENALAGQQVLALAVSALGDDMRILAKQQDVFDRAGFAHRNDALLQRVRVGIPD